MVACRGRPSSVGAYRRGRCPELESSTRSTVGGAREQARPSDARSTIPYPGVPQDRVLTYRTASLPSTIERPRPYVATRHLPGLRVQIAAASHFRVGSPRPAARPASGSISRHRLAALRSRLVALLGADVTTGSTGTRLADHPGDQRSAIAGRRRSRRSTHEQPSAYAAQPLIPESASTSVLGRSASAELVAEAGSSSTTESTRASGVASGGRARRGSARSIGLAQYPSAPSAPLALIVDGHDHRRQPHPLPFYGRSPPFPTNYTPQRAQAGLASSWICVNSSKIRAWSSAGCRSRCRRPRTRSPFRVGARAARSR